MTSPFKFIGLSVLVSALACLTTGCPRESRGDFNADSCPSAARIGVYPEAKSAVYFDAQGTPLGTQAEDLTGTTNNRMCLTPPPPGSGNCPQTFCPHTVNGKTYCLKC